MLGGGKTETPFPEKVLLTDATPALEVTGLHSPTSLRDVSLTLRKGEIVG